MRPRWSARQDWRSGRGARRALAAALLFLAATALAQTPTPPSRIGARVISEAKDLVSTETIEIDEPMPVPHALPVPAGAASFRFEPLIVPAPAPSSTAPLQSFAALGDDNTSVPPDTNGAVGTNHLLVTLNSQVQVQARGGAAVQTLSLRTFFDPVRNGRVFDPHVAFDARAGQWIAAAVGDQKVTTNGTRTGSGVLLAVSDGIDPTGRWSEYRFDAPANVWYDYPLFGYDDAKITISLNVYALADNQFLRAVIYVIPRSNPASAVKFDLPNLGGGMAPTVSLDAGTATYLLQTWNSNSGGAGYLRLYSVSAAAITPVAFVPSPAPWGHLSAEDIAPQLGRPEKIDAGDDRLNGAVLRNGSIWAAQTIYLPSPSRASVQWWQVSPTGTPQQRGTIDDPSGEFFYAYPSIAVNRRNDALLGFSRFSATTFASTGYATRAGGDAPNAMSPPVVFKNGEAPYYKIFSTTTTRNRWGDYSAAVVDPRNDVDFWALEEYAALPIGSDRWGTWWVQVTMPAPPRRRAARH